jgi:8-oxo-dGTP pyrophosphatase MutT (NUDIX family)
MVMEDKQTWNTIKKEKLLHTPVFDVYKENAVCLRNNFPWDFYTIECPHDWVTVVAVTENKEIVMVKQFRYGSKKDELEVPGGLADKDGETVLEAGIRELREETGYVGSDAKVLGKVCPNPAIQGNNCFTVLVENAEKLADTEFDSSEDIQTVLIPLTQLRSDILEGRITHGLALNSLYFYELEMQKRND